MEQSQRQGFLYPRLGRVLLFIAIVWLVAGSFVAIEIAALGGFGFLLSTPGLTGNIVLSNATRDSKTCASESVATSARAASAEARVTAWLMGLMIGRDALARQYASVDQKTLEAGLNDIASFANTLRVPTPRPFVPRQLANANSEFIAFVESDSNETARSLAREHTAQACHLFKLGALWGYTNLVRPHLPGERSLFAAEIRHHAQSAAIDSALWQPMIENTKASASSKEIFDADAALTDRLTRYLGSER